MTTSLDTDTGALKESLAVMSDREIVAYWNIMQFPGLVVGKNRNDLHIPVVAEILTERGIPFERGARTVAA